MTGCVSQMRQVDRLYYSIFTTSTATTCCHCQHIYAYHTNVCAVNQSANPMYTLYDNIGPTFLYAIQCIQCVCLYICIYIYIYRYPMSRWLNRSCIWTYCSASLLSLHLSFHIPCTEDTSHSADGWKGIWYLSEFLVTSEFQMVLLNG